MAEETCFVFKPKKTSANERFSKEREEYTVLSERRKLLYSNLWGRLENNINEEIDAAHAQTLYDIKSFINSTSSAQFGGKIPTALIVTGPNASSRLFEQLQSRFLEDSNVIYTSIAPIESTNLKSTVRNFIIKATQAADGQEVEDADLNRPHGPKLLNYDLEILQGWCKRHNIRQIVVELQNSEAFDVAVLTEFTLLLHSWVDRLPVVILFGIATSVGEFQTFLPTATTRCLQGQSYDVAKTDEIIERIFESSVNNVQLHLGPSFGSFILQRARENAQNSESFLQSIQYAYMSHFYGNPTSIFLDDELSHDDFSPELFDAVRNFPSFRVLAENLLERNQGRRAGALLQSNDALFLEISTGIQMIHQTIDWLFGALRTIHYLRRSLAFKHSPSLSSLYITALAGNLESSAILGEVLLSVKRISSDKLTDALPNIYDTLMSMPASNDYISPDDFGDIQDDLMQLLNTHDSSTGPLQVQDLKPSRVNRTSVVTKKASSIGRQSEKPSANEHAYTELVTRFHDLLHNYFRTCLVPVNNQFPYEIMFYDTKALHHNSLTPRPRVAVERALASPQDYLGCSCCVKSTGGMISTQPATAILYQLYLESGALINVFDLWSAFTEVISRHHDDEQMVMALFFRSLATLRYMGMLKPSRRRIDHLGKTMWKGL